MSTDLDTFLAHYGVKGMKWGVRRSTPGVSRVKGAALDRNQRRTAKFKRVAEGRGTIGDKVYALNRINSGQLIVNRGLKGAANKKVADLENQRDRILTGKTTVRDKLGTALTLKATDLLVSVTDERG